jgi:RNA polymerase sigma factor (sigma-70 family)
MTTTEPSRNGPVTRSEGVGLPPFQQLLDEHTDAVLRCLRAVVASRHVDDCFQETFLAALRAYPGLRDASNLRGWLLTIARRKAVDALRREARQAVPVEHVPEPLAEQEHDLDLWEAVAGLPEGQRQAVAHRYVLGLGYAEVGAILGCSEAAARQRVSAGLKTLRKVHA